VINDNSTVPATASLTSTTVPEPTALLLTAQATLSLGMVWGLRRHRA
jgi:hypothetical protein